MQSLVARLESKGHHTSKDISDLRAHIVSIQSRVDISLVAISKSLVVLHDRIESIAQNQETLKNLVSAPLVLKEVRQETNSRGNSPLTPVMECEELPDSPIETPVRFTFPDITCYETIGAYKQHGTGQTSRAGGTGDFLEWEKVEELIKNWEKHT